MHLLITGIFLGWGAAIPIGPMNLEIMRRNLRYGFLVGLFFGLGACLADISYLALISLGLLNFLNQPLVLKFVGLIGASILLWFGFKAFRMPVGAMQEKKTSLSLLPNLIEGLSLTLLNPFTILFWASISTQLPLLASTPWQLMIVGGGLTIGTVSWVLVLNAVLHFIRYRINDKLLRYLNYAGGIIVIGFAIFGIIYALSLG